MRPRQDIVENFSTFIQLEAEQFSGWMTDARLRRSMQQSLTQFPKPETSERFWALYWYKVWQTTPESLAKGHLSAYLQEICYWAAQKTAAGFANIHYSLADCFQIAIATLDKVLEGFNPKQGVALKYYASAIFKSSIREILRQRQEVDICTPWALLRKLSQKRLTESLAMAGLNSETIERYLLAWRCFNEIYVPTQTKGTRRLPKPDVETWNAIATLYNQQRYQQLSTPGEECTPEAIEKSLTASVKAARNYLYPSVTSINTPKSGEDNRELQDELVAFEGESLFNQVIAEEEATNRQTQQQQLTEILSNAIEQLKNEEKQLITLYYSEQLTQQEMAEKTGMKQYTVSRRLSKAKQTLLKALGKWTQETLHINLTSDVLKDASPILEEWLTTRMR
ncbi:MAG: sigma-70 family RNA polymerase sigma factor [Halothece sp.]